MVVVVSGWLEQETSIKPMIESANASGAISAQQARVKIVFFIMMPPC